MAILVLGGAGYIGSHMVDRLVEAGQEKVVVVDNLVTGHRAAVHPDAVFYQGDLADQDFMRKVFKENPDVDAVIHFAAYSLVAESMEKPLKYFDNNTAGMVRLLEVMNECGVKYIVFSSTAATYGIPETKLTASSMSLFVTLMWRGLSLTVLSVRTMVLKPTSCQLFSKWLKVFVRKS